MRRFAAILIACIAPFAAACFAGEPAPTPPAATTEPAVMQKVISCEFVDTPLLEALQHLEKQAGLTFSVDDAVKIIQPQPTLTLSIKDLPLRVALNQTVANAFIDAEAVFVDGKYRIRLQQYVRDIPGPFFPLSDTETELLNREAQRLSSKVAAERDGASDIIVAIGINAVPRLQELLKDAASSEARTAIKKILQRIAYSPDAVFMRLKMTLQMKNRVKIPIKDQPLQDALLQIFSRLKGKSFAMIVDDAVSKTKVSLDGAEIEMGEAVKRLLDAADAKIIDDSPAKFTITKK